MWGNRLGNSFTLVPGTAPSTWQMLIVGGSFLQPSCNVFPHVPFKFTFQTALLFGVGELGRQRLQGSVDSIPERHMAPYPCWRKCWREEAWIVVGSSGACD